MMPSNNNKPPSKRSSAKKRQGESTKTPRNAGARRKPRRSLNAYNFFFMEQRKKIVEERDTKSPAERLCGADLFSSMGRTIADRWKELGDGDKVSYQSLAEQDKVRYSKEMELYNRGLLTDQLKASGDHSRVSEIEAEATAATESQVVVGAAAVASNYPIVPPAAAAAMAQSQYQLPQQQQHVAHLGLTQHPQMPEAVAAAPQYSSHHEGGHFLQQGLAQSILIQNELNIRAQQLSNQQQQQTASSDPNANLQEQLMWYLQQQVQPVPSPAAVLAQAFGAMQAEQQQQRQQQASGLPLPSESSLPSRMAPSFQNTNVPYSTGDNNAVVSELVPTVEGPSASSRESLLGPEPEIRSEPNTNHSDFGKPNTNIRNS